MDSLLASWRLGVLAFPLLGSRCVAAPTDGLVIVGGMKSELGAEGQGESKIELF